MGAYDSRRRVPIKQVYKSLVELQRFSTFRMFRMVGAVTVTTILACVLRLLFNDQEPFSFRIADMLGNDFNHTFQLGEETTSPVDFITAIWGVVVTICLGVAFQNEHYVSDRDAIGDFSGLLMCSSLATAFITGFWLPEMYHTNGAAKMAIITGAGCLLMGWILNYGSQIYITHRTMTHNERARNVDLRQYVQMRALRTRGRWPVWAVAVCAVNALFWLALAGMGGQMGRLRDGGWAAAALFAAALLATVMVLLYAYVRQRFVKAIASRMWGAAAAAVLAVVELVVLWYAGVLLWVAFTGAQAVRPWVVEAIAVWSLVNVAAARFVICRLAIHPARAVPRRAIHAEYHAVAALRPVRAVGGFLHDCAARPERIRHEPAVDDSAVAGGARGPGGGGIRGGTRAGMGGDVLSASRGAWCAARRVHLKRAARADLCGEAPS